MQHRHNSLQLQQQHQQQRAVSAGATTLQAAAGDADEVEDIDDAERARRALLKEDFGANVEVDPKRVAVLFDFDGTIGDTETPAMEVAYWELAPYFPEAASKCDVPGPWCVIGIRDSAYDRLVGSAVAVFDSACGACVLCAYALSGMMSVS